MTAVGGYEVVEDHGLWFMLDGERIAGTIVDMGHGVWRCRTPAGTAVTLTVPGDVDEPAVYVAEQVTR